MAKIFIGGSRTIRELDPLFKTRLDRIAKDHQVYVGDAAGADSLVQEYLYGIGALVEICYSGKEPRANRFKLPLCKIEATKGASGYQFHAAKDRAMAEMSNYGLMAWDGESPGSLLNVLRMVGMGKPCVLFINHEKRFVEFRTRVDWNCFLETLDISVLSRARSRAQPWEWSGEQAEPKLNDFKP